MFLDTTFIISKWEGKLNILLLVASIFKDAKGLEVLMEEKGGKSNDLKRYRFFSPMLFTQLIRSMTRIMESGYAGT